MPDPKTPPVRVPEPGATQNTPVKEPEPERLPDEEPTPNPDEKNREPPKTAGLWRPAMIVACGGRRGDRFSAKLLGNLLAAARLGAGHV